jgi:ABC-type Fe3+-siderophore transport system permease subunit
LKKLTGWQVAILIGVPLAIILLSLFLGRYPKPYWMPPELLSSDPLARSLVLNLRLPRLIAAFVLGMSLAAAGAVMQMLFRNPLVEPGFLGVTQGAAFGAGLSILFIGSFPPPSLHSQDWRFPTCWHAASASAVGSCAWSWPESPFPHCFPPAWVFSNTWQIPPGNCRNWCSGCWEDCML